jgi:hypothetical protein
MAIQGTTLNLSTAFRPSTDGQSERTIQYIGEYLRTFVHPSQHDWNELISLAEYSYNARHHGSIGMSPFEADLGFVPRGPVQLASHQMTRTKMGVTVPDPSKSDDMMEEGDSTRNRRQLPYSSTDYDLSDVTTGVSEFLKIQSGQLRKAQDALKLAQEKMKRQYDRNRRAQKFNMGEKVLLSSKNMAIHHTGSLGARKLAPRWIGPYEVIEVLPHDNYRLDIDSRHHPVFHTSMLKPYVHSKRSLPPNPVVMRDGNTGYLVEDVIGVRVVKGRRQYKIRWLGYNPNHDSWEPEENLSSIKGLLERFQKSQSHRSQHRQR